MSTGGTARALRDAGLPVTDVAAVTGFPEMLDGRVKTLHPRVHAGILADRRLADHRRQLVAAAIAPFELVVVNLYPFAAAAERPGITLDELVEEIDIGGPSMVRAAAKNHASVAIVTSPGRYAAVLAALGGGGRASRSGCASRAGDRGVPPHRRLRRPDRGRAAGSDGRRRRRRCPTNPACPARPIRTRRRLTIGLEKVETLRYGENPHQPAARYRRPGAGRPTDGPFATGAPPLQGKALSYNNVLDASAAAALARVAARAGLRDRQAHEPVRRRRAADAARRLAGGPCRRSRVRIRRRRRRSPARSTAPLAEAPRRRSSSRSSSRPASSAAALAILAAKPNLRLVVDPSLDGDPDARHAGPPDPLGAIRTAGGAVLVGAPDSAPDDSGGVDRRHLARPDGRRDRATSTSPGGSSGA